MINRWTQSMLSGALTTLGAPLDIVCRPRHGWHDLAVEKETDPPPLESCPSGCLRVATFNLAHGRGRGLLPTFRRSRLEKQLQDLGALVRQRPVDVMGLQEAEGAGLWHPGLSQTRLLAQSSGLIHHAQGRHMQAGHMVYGTALMSRLPLLAAWECLLPRTGLSLHKGMVLGSVQTDFGPVLVGSVHLDFLHESYRRRQVQYLSRLLQQHRDEPLILMGDFNTDAQHGGALQHLADELNLQMWQAQGGETTFHKLRHRRLDWILVSRHFRFSSYVNWLDLVSDHVAVRADLEWH